MRASIVGAGNVATHLACALSRSGVSIEGVAARHLDSARRLAGLVGAKVAAGRVGDLPVDVDFVLIAVSDGAVAEVAAELPQTKALVMHTSGSVPLEALASRHARAAVLYPLQTFSREVPVDVSQVPFFTEATGEATLAEVDSVARLMSEHVYHADSVQRQRLHIAGVLSSNFTVYLLEQCRRVLEPAGFPLEVVRTLTATTLAKAFAVGPHEAMTGPARRGDLAVVEAQAAKLPPDVAAVYRTISAQIYRSYHECDKL